MTSILAITVLLPIIGAVAVGAVPAIAGQPNRLLSRNLALFRDFGYLKRRPVADEALGFPALPEGYQITISTASGVMSAALKLSYSSEIRDLPLGAIAYVG